MSKTINSKDYFCINCFADENIRNIIKSNGRLVKNQKKIEGFIELIKNDFKEKQEFLKG